MIGFTPERVIGFTGMRTMTYVRVPRRLLEDLLENVEMLTWSETHPFIEGQVAQLRSYVTSESGGNRDARVTKSGGTVIPFPVRTP